MSDSLLGLAYQLTQTEEPFVLATVVRCERPTSAKPGAQALIQRNGEVSGWIGGSCAQPIVIRESLRMLREGDPPYLLRLGTSGDDMQLEGIRYFPMTCASGGVLDIYLEPHLPLPQLVLVGQSPVSTALEQMASALPYHVVHIDHADLSQVHMNERTVILIATHGQYDEDVLEQAVKSPAAYIGMVASRRRADACREYLRSSGVQEHLIARLHAPAGLDLGSVTPEEIAVSILAELVQLSHHNQQNQQNQQQQPTIQVSVPQQLINGDSYSRDKARVEKQLETASDGADLTVGGTAIDPVCGMSVEIANARHHSSYEGQDFYFCCPSCKRLFERNPQEYRIASSK